MNSFWLTWSTASEPGLTNSMKQEPLVVKKPRFFLDVSNHLWKWIFFGRIHDKIPLITPPPRSLGTLNTPLALRGHATNPSFKQWVGILLMPKIDRAYKNYLTPKIWEETHLKELFYVTLIFQQSSMICIGRHVGGQTLALQHVQHGGQNYFFLTSCWTFESYAQMCCERYHIIFSTLSLKFKCKICVQKEVIHNFENHILVTWPATNLLVLRKWCGFEKPNHYYFV